MLPTQNIPWKCLSPHGRKLKEKNKKKGQLGEFNPKSPFDHSRGCRQEAWNFCHENCEVVVRSWHVSSEKSNFVKQFVGCWDTVWPQWIVSHHLKCDYYYFFLTLIEWCYLYFPFFLGHNHMPSMFYISN